MKVAKVNGRNEPGGDQKGRAKALPFFIPVILKRRFSIKAFLLKSVLYVISSF